jgi:hypothetical protein
MTTEQLLHDALHDDADEPTVPVPWDDVRGRGVRIRRRRRVGQGAVAAVAVVAVAAGALALVGAFSDGGGGTRRGVVATPTPGAATDDIVVDRGDRIEIIDATDGHVITTVATGIDTNPGGVSATPDGAAVVYTRQSSTGRCGSEVVEQPLTPGARAHVLVGHSWDPLVSPDGQWVAYVMNDSCESDHPSGGDFIGLTNLHTGLNYRPFEQQLGDHPGKPALFGWSPDSSELVFLVNGQTWDGRGLLALRDPPLAHGRDPESVRGGADVGAAAFLPNGHLLVARLTSRGPRLPYEVVELDGAGNVVATRFRGEGPVQSMASDPSGTRLLVVRPDGGLLLEDATGAPRVIATGVRSGAWLPAG